MNKISYLATYSDNNMISTIDYAKLIKLLAQYSNLEENNNYNYKSENKKIIRKRVYGNRKILGD